MAKPSEPPLTAQLAGALAWWTEAGVDCDFSDDATAWLGDEARTASAKSSERQPAISPQTESAPSPPPQTKIGGSKDGWPTDLETFREWWLSSPDLDGGGAFPRLAPVGIGEAELMVIVPEPEADDRETLLSGPQGRLLRGFLSAAGLSAETAYIAAALPRHTPMADWDALNAAGLGGILRHHVALASPKRILALGRLVLPLLGHEMTQGPAVLRDFNHDGRSIPLMGTGSLDAMLRSAGRRERFWRNWLDWTYGKSNAT